MKMVVAANPPLIRSESRGDFRNALWPKLLASFATFVLLFLGTPTIAQEDNASDEIARWDFGAEETRQLVSHGNVQRDQAGPRPPEFPDTAANNTAVRLDSGAYLSVSDDGP